MDFADNVLAFIGVLALYAAMIKTNEILWKKNHPTNEMNNHGENPTNG